ncbi:Ganglioside GM2 activator [Halotydeus destructor]|nr:Ganglioside GM2 activator [Halotydeus destructor]
MEKMSLRGSVLVLITLSSVMSTQSKKLSLESFSWNDCSANHDTALIKDITVAPDPLVLPGDVTVGFDFSLFKNITSGANAYSTVMYKKVAFVWVELPCENQWGSCDYKDFCGQWAIPSPCPAAYPEHGIPCTCPFLAGDYSLPPSVVGTVVKIGPSWLDSGSFRIKAVVNDPKGNNLVCFNLYLTLKRIK